MLFEDGPVALAGDCAGTVSDNGARDCVGGAGIDTDNETLCGVAFFFTLARWALFDGRESLISPSSTSLGMSITVSVSIGVWFGCCFMAPLSWYIVYLLV